MISCFTNNYGAFGVRTAVEKIRSAGIEHLELALRGHNLGGLVIPESAVVTERADDATVQKFLELLNTHGVKISGCNVGGGDMRTVEGRELTERRIRFAGKWFKVSIVVSGASQPTNLEERQAVIANLRSVGKVAAENGIVVAIETHKGPTENAKAMLALMNDVDHPAIRLNFDTGNIGYYNQNVDPADELEKVKDLVRNVHVKDSRGRFEDWYFPAIGEGVFNFTRIRQILESVHYQGAYSIEIEGIQGEPEPGLEGRHERVRKSVAHLRSCGYR